MATIQLPWYGNILKEITVTSKTLLLSYGWGTEEAPAQVAEHLREQGFQLTRNGHMLSVYANHPSKKRRVVRLLNKLFPFKKVSKKDLVTIENITESEVMSALGLRY